MSQTINEHLDAISKLADLSLLMSNRIVLLEEEIAIIKKEIYNRNELGFKFITFWICTVIVFYISDKLDIFVNKPTYKFSTFYGKFLCYIISGFLIALLVYCITT